MGRRIDLPAVDAGHFHQLGIADGDLVFSVQHLLAEGLFQGLGYFDSPFIAFGYSFR